VEGMGYLYADSSKFCITKEICNYTVKKKKSKAIPVTGHAGL
jgi:hypothetical protein